MKKYKIIAQPLIGEDSKKEYIIEAENEESAKKIVIDRMLEEEFNGTLLDSPGQILTVEEVGYLYGHKFQPRRITDLLDNAEIYIAEMRATEDMETIPKALKQYAWGYLRNTELNKELLHRWAIFVADKTYRVISDIEVLDNYTRAFFARIMPYLWDRLQDRGVDIFYILDNKLCEDRFRAVVELFELTGMAVVTPYGEHGNLEYEEVEKKIKDYMAPIRNIMYIEKNANINYIDKVIKLAKESKYLVIARNKAPSDSKVVVLNSDMEHND